MILTGFSHVLSSLFKSVQPDFTFPFTIRNSELSSSFILLSSSFPPLGEKTLKRELSTTKNRSPTFRPELLCAGFIGLGILTVILNVMVLWFVLFAALGMDFLIRYKTTFAGLILFCDGFCGHRHGFPSFDGALCPVRLYRFHSQVAKDAASPHFIF
ncbi:hypothetical protein [Holdemania sp. 1001302B_160321_E10]|uniref:hypothetical protein n=1 Tax=Holdemania sp. 1001302B_160321_E10 TaxID=2787120 RepID=UPI001897F531|nr:hypothetical protein [Holdemania sp. 1001302B_160321_E10]